MQAIQTKFRGPTNYRDSRIIARCDAKRRIYSWDHALGIEENHAAAARMLAQELGWLDRGNGRTFRLESGSLPGSGYCHVLVPVD